MGDRCYLHVGVRKEDAEMFEEIVEATPQDWDDCGLFKTFIDEQSDYGSEEELMKAASEGLVFYGHHGAGADYPAAQFASDGDGRLFMMPCIHVQGGLEPVVVVDKLNGKVPDHARSDALATMAAFNRVRDMAFPPQEPEDFGEKVAGLIAHGLNDDEIYECLGYDAGEMLVALVRVLMSKQQLEDE